MMTTIFIAVIVFMLAVAGLCVGTLAGRRPLKGSCGGCANCLTRGKKHD
jgi:hypothetical protein